MTTKTAQFTPGPWDCDNAWAVGKRAANGSLDLIANLSYSCFQDAKDADANLIAAAPAMYEALQFVRKFYQDNFENMPVAFQTVDNICATALSQAEGR